MRTRGFPQNRYFLQVSIPGLGVVRVRQIGLRLPTYRVRRPSRVDYPGQTAGVGNPGLPFFAGASRQPWRRTGTLPHRFIQRGRVDRRPRSHNPVFDQRSVCAEDIKIVKGPVPQLATSTVYLPGGRTSPRISFFSSTSSSADPLGPLNSLKW